MNTALRCRNQTSARSHEAYEVHEEYEEKKRVSPGGKSCQESRELQDSNTARRGRNQTAAA
jgi:hypothetical protein